MRKTLFALACVLLFPRFASATWISGTIADLQPYPDGRTLAIVVYADDKGNSDKQSLVADPSAMRASILAELARRNASDSVKIDLPIGAIVTIPPPVVDTPRAKFFKDYFAYLLLKPYADLGIKAAVDALPAALQLVTDEFKIEYVTTP